MTFIDHRADYGYTITTPNGDSIRRIVERDGFRRSLVTNCVTYFNSSLVDSNTYAFDALSRPIARTTGTTGVSPVDSTFAYNSRSEVVSAAIGTNLFTHAYDDIGNHLLFGDNAVTYTFTHNQVNQMVGRAAPSAPPTSFTYTPDGGLSSDGTWTYAYDAEDQLRSVISRSITNGAIRVLNTYDYRHRRTSKTVQRLNSTVPPPPAPPIGMQEWETFETQTFVYDDWNLIHETIYAIEGSITNITEVQYFWGLDLSGTLQGAGGVGGLLAVSRNGEFYFPAYDNNGNVTKYIDESGNIVAAYEYDDFGRTISQSGPLADFFRHRFSTKYYDPETGLYYYGYRYYKPRIMCWLTEDPIGDSGGANLYAFCGNSVTVLFDKLGRFPSSTRQCSKNGVVISFVFDGKTLSGGSFSTTAASGRPQKTNTPLTLVTDKFGRIIGTRVTYNYEFDYSKERQKIRDVGPTPEGTYYILVNEKRTKWNSVRTHILRHAGWGDYGWSLHPEPNTETYGRSGFFIHGGSEWGSAGCIDLTNGDEKLSRFLEGLCNCYIPVVVKYVVDRNTISETYTDMSPE